MLPIAWYLLKVMICSGILFGYYWILLRNKVFHQYNRFYLLVTVILSLALPMIQINFWQQNELKNPVINVLQAVSSGDEYMNNIIISTKQQHWNLQQLYPFIYLLISTFFLALFVRTLLAIRTLLKKYPVQILDKVSFIKTDDKRTPFSFLHFIFWNNEIDPESTSGQKIFKHEVAHVQEKHTFDKLFINIILMVAWCNPFFWLIRKELNMIHEFIADKKAIEDSDTAAFADMILQASYPQHRFQLTNNFFYSPIKRRLLMLTKNKNPKVNYIGRVLVLPLALMVFAAFTLKTKSPAPFHNGLKTALAIDPVEYPFQVIKDTVPKKLAYETVLDKKNAELVKDIDKDKALMVVNGKIFGKGKDFTGNNITAGTVYVQWLVPSVAIKKYGKQAEFGACEITYSGTPGLPTDVISDLPRIYVGEITGSRADVNVFKKQKEIRTTTGYEFVSTDVYFSGEGFKNIVMAHLQGSSLKPVEEFLERCTAGTAVTFDKVRLKDIKGEVRTIDGRSYSLYDGNVENQQLIKVKMYDSLGNFIGEKFVPMQKKQDSQDPDNLVFSKVEVESQFPGGNEGWKNYLIKNLKAITPVDEGWKAGKYTVIVQFIVHADGHITDVTTTNYKGSKTAQHCIDIIQKVPKWVPAMQNGMAVNAYKRQPITFLIEESN